MLLAVKEGVVMVDKKYRNFTWLKASVYSHFNLWTHSLRTILMVIFILLMNYMLAKSYENSVSLNQWNVYFGETLFSYISSGFNIIMTSVALLVMLSELPKQVAYQNYMLMRLSRRKWLISLLVFSVCIVTAFIILMITTSALFSLTFITDGTGWSDLERTAKDPEYAHSIQQYIPIYIRSLTPSIACILAAIVLFFFWTTMALVILLFSLYDAPNLGLVFCVSLLLLNIIILFESLPEMKLPIQFATLNAIVSQVEEHKLRLVLFILIGYVIGDAILIKIMDNRVKQMDIRFLGKE